MNTNEHNINFANNFDCGDGVPALSFDRNAELQVRGRIEKEVVDQAEAKVTAKTFVLAATVVAQLIVGAAMIVSGNPAVGAVAILAIGGCGLVLLLAGLTNNDLEE